MVRSDFPDRKFADGGENYTLKHIKAASFGDFGPVFRLQLLFGNQLKGVGCVVDLADLIQLASLCWANFLEKSTQLRGFYGFF